MSATIHVFTFKAGLLARLAHDLRLTAHKHELTLEAQRIRGYCAADSLTVDGVMGAHGLDPSALSDKDKRQILETVQGEILESRRYPRIEFEGQVQKRSAQQLTLSGNLRLKNQTRPIVTELMHSGDRLQATFELKPSEFGIAPYKALAGAIRLDDRVRVSIAVALNGQDPLELLARAQALQL
jgi:hypothetical protein